jgi:hypothetical protein
MAFYNAWHQFFSVVNLKYIIRLRTIIRRILSIIMKILNQPPRRFDMFGAAGRPIIYSFLSKASIQTDLMHKHVKKLLKPRLEGDEFGAQFWHFHAIDPKIGCRE